MLKNSKWLADTLGLSLSTIKKLRFDDPLALPPWIKIGNSYRYDENVVKAWLEKKFNKQLEK
jgi:predicted DNA-binding transcriptional regulator AlpA